ncbi:MAG: hypothetical protein AAF478_04640 [Pseudomonadota bacterium]
MAIIGNIGNFYTNMLKARERHAERSVHAYFAQYDDATLGKLGIKREELKKGGTVSYFW